MQEDNERKHPVAQELNKLSLGEAFEEIKVFKWDGDYRPAAREAIKRILEQEMALQKYLDTRRST